MRRTFCLLVLYIHWELILYCLNKKQITYNNFIIWTYQLLIAIKTFDFSYDFQWRILNQGQQTIILLLMKACIRTSFAFSHSRMQPNFILRNLLYDIGTNIKHVAILFLFSLILWCHDWWVCKQILINFLMWANFSFLFHQ